MDDHDMWYLTVDVIVKGEHRGFSRQIKARTARPGVTIPAQVETICAQFLSDVITNTDVFAYSSVLAGERVDWPYRFAQYHLQCNGATVVRACTTRPIKPEVLV